MPTANSGAKKEKPVKPPVARKAAAKKVSGAGAGAAKAASAKKPEKRLEKVPVEYVFYCCDGGVYSDLAELAAGLAAMSDETFTYHSNSEKQDFCNWVRDVIDDIELANDLALVTSRLEAAGRVADRILLLSQ